MRSKRKQHTDRPDLDPGDPWVAGLPSRRGQTQEQRAHLSILRTPSSRLETVPKLSDHISIVTVGTNQSYMAPEKHGRRREVSCE